MKGGAGKPLAATAAAERFACLAKKLAPAPAAVRADVASSAVPEGRRFEFAKGDFGFDRLPAMPVRGYRLTVRVYKKTNVW